MHIPYSTGDRLLKTLQLVTADKADHKHNSTMTASSGNQQRSASMRALVLLVALTGACAFHMPSPVPSVARPISLSAPRSLSVNAVVVERKSHLSMKSVNADVVAAASNRSRATKVRPCSLESFHLALKLHPHMNTRAHSHSVLTFASMYIVHADPHTSGSLLLHPSAHTAPNGIARTRCCQGSCRHHRALAHGSKDCQFFPLVWNSRPRCLGHYLGLASGRIARCHSCGCLDGSSHYDRLARVCHGQHDAYYSVTVAVAKRPHQESHVPHFESRRQENIRTRNRIA
jgi:hypothetical protein